VWLVWSVVSNSCGNVKFQATESGKRNCITCRSETLSFGRETEERSNTNWGAKAGKQGAAWAATIDGKQVMENVNNWGTKCLVLGDSITRNIGANKPSMRVECFPGIRADQLHRVMEKRMLGCLDTVVIHMGTNDVKWSRNLDYVMGEVYQEVCGVTIPEQSARERVGRVRWTDITIHTA
jgi:hypothetical protein